MAGRRGVEELVPRQAHNLEIAGSSPAPATHMMALWHRLTAALRGWLAMPEKPQTIVFHTSEIDVDTQAYFAGGCLSNRRLIEVEHLGLSAEGESPRRARSRRPLPMTQKVNPSTT